MLHGNNNVYRLYNIDIRQPISAGVIGLSLFVDVSTGVDLSKILGGQTKILEGKVVKSDKCMGASQLFGARAQAAPKSTPMVVGLYVLFIHSFIHAFIHSYGAFI